MTCGVPCVRRQRSLCHAAVTPGGCSGAPLDGAAILPVRCRLLLKASCTDVIAAHSDPAVWSLKTSPPTMPRVSSLWCLLVLFGPLSVGCGRTSQPSWVSECRRYLDDNPVVDMRDHCMSGFFDHYTATTEHTVGHPPDAACLAQVSLVQQCRTNPQNRTNRRHSEGRGAHSGAPNFDSIHRAVRKDRDLLFCFFSEKQGLWTVPR